MRSCGERGVRPIAAPTKCSQLNDRSRYRRPSSPRARRVISAGASGLTRRRGRTGRPCANADIVSIAANPTRRLQCATSGSPVAASEPTTIPTWCPHGWSHATASPIRQLVMSVLVAVRPRGAPSTPVRWDASTRRAGLRPVPGRLFRRPQGGRPGRSKALGRGLVAGGAGLRTGAGRNLASKRLLATLPP